MTATPRDPAHADKTTRITGADPRLTLHRELLGYDLATPRYRWHLLLDGRTTGRWGRRRRDLVADARAHDARYWAAYPTG